MLVFAHIALHTEVSRDCFAFFFLRKDLEDTGKQLVRCVCVCAHAFYHVILVQSIYIKTYDLV